MLIGSLFPLISIPIITHSLSPFEFGIFAIIQVYGVLVVGLSNMGLLVGYERNFFDYGKDVLKISSLFYSALIFSFFMTCIVGLLIYIFNEKILNWISLDIKYLNVVILVFFGESLHKLSQFYFTYLKNSGFASTFAIISVFRSVTYFGLIIYFIQYLKLGILGLGYAAFLSGFIIFVITLIQSFRDIKFSVNLSVLLSTIKISFPLAPQVLIGFLNTQFDKIMLSIIASFGGVGIYSIGQKISLVIFQFMTALEHVFIPATYERLFSEKDEIKKSLGKYLTPFLYMSVFFALLVLLFSEELFLLFLPPSYDAGVDVVVVLSIYYAAMFFGKLSGTQLIFAKKMYLISTLTLVSVIINVILNIPMIQMWGVMGAATATLIAGLINSVLAYKIADKYIKINWEWEKIIIVYGLLIGAAFWVLITRLYLSELYELRLLGKIVFLFSFLWIGYLLNILNKELLINLYKQAMPKI